MTTSSAGLTLDQAVTQVDAISAATNGSALVGRCYYVNMGRAERCATRWKGDLWLVAKDGCAPCRSNVLAAMLSDSLRLVRQHRLEDESYLEDES